MTTAAPILTTLIGAQGVAPLSGLPGEWRLRKPAAMPST